MSTVKQAMVIHLQKLPATLARNAKVWSRIARPNARLPYATVQQLTKSPSRHLGGKSNLSDTLLQVDLWHDDESEVNDWAAELELAMDAFRGTLGHGAVNVAADVALVDETDFVERPVDGSAVGPYRVSQDYRVWHDRPTS